MQRHVIQVKSTNVAPCTLLAEAASSLLCLEPHITALHTPLSRSGFCEAPRSACRVALWGSPASQCD